MVTQAKFEELQVDVESVKGRVTKLESGSGITSQSPDLQSLYSQLNRLDPANKSLAIHDSAIMICRRGSIL